MRIVAIIVVGIVQFGLSSCSSFECEYGSGDVSEDCSERRAIYVPNSGNSGSVGRVINYEIPCKCGAGSSAPAVKEPTDAR